MGALLDARRAAGLPDRPSPEVLAEVGRVLAEVVSVDASTPSAVPAAVGGVDGSPELPGSPSPLPLGRDGPGDPTTPHAADAA